MNYHNSDLTDILQAILKVFQNHKTPQSLNNKFFLNELNVILLTRKPITHSFICDQKVSVQIQFKNDKTKQLQSYDLDPFNKISTHYYQVTYDHDKYQYTLNCNDKTLIQKYNYRPMSYSDTIYNQQKNNQEDYGMFPQDQYKSGSALQNIQKDYIPHAYQPLFYFNRSIFQKFLQNRNNLRISQPLQKIKITEWLLKIVNISKSGSYGIVIEIYKYKFTNERFYADKLINEKQKQKDYNILDLKNVGSIIYEQKLQSILEKMRIKNIKQQFASEIENQDQQISMCYHLRNVQTTHKLPKISQLVTLDQRKEILKFDQNCPVHFIPIGQIQGMCTFSQPIHLKKQEKFDHLKQLNSFSMKGLYEILNKQSLRATKQKKVIQKIKRNRHLKIGNEHFTKMIQQRLQNSSYLIRRQRNNISNTEQWDQDSLWSQTQQQGMNQKIDQQSVQKEVIQQQNEYSKVLRSDGQSSSEEEENQYFRKFREEMRKLREK